MISDGFEWSWFPVKPFGIHEIFMRIIKIMYHTISSSLIYIKGIHIDSSLEKRAKTKLVVGIQDLEAQVENFFCFIETNILFGWMDIDVCL